MNSDGQHGRIMDTNQQEIDFLLTPGVPLFQVGNWVSFNIELGTHGLSATRLSMNIDQSETIIQDTSLDCLSNHYNK
ncbi:hypothetical protein [Pedobacter jeongneungensis]|uniref:hypothetical protein n=1 Tax=Pedobacter jeongneungensis TaxID=947309 RepID=UPI0013B3F687|nr:hypothetical protein [Pedobacter jeongneungensis]